MAEVFASRGSSVIQSAKVTISDRVENRDLKSVMLEEVVQSLGLLTDIHGRHYHNKSIFSETGWRIKRLRGQDAKAILYHYPR